jgi:hypothetical protein
MQKINNITTEVHNGFIDQVKKEEIDIEEIMKYFTEGDADAITRVTAGRVFQKNKKINFIETLFKLIEEEISKMESKNNRDSDNSFFNLNKKILSNNLYNVKEIIKQYNLDEKRISDFLLGTVIQSIYDSKK